MEKKAKFFRNIVANLVIVAVLAVTVSYAARDNSTAVSSGEPIYQGSSVQNVSVMVNVYWGTENLDAMLRIFKEHGVKTTFFVGGTWVAEHNQTLNKLIAAGHEIGNHGFFNKDHKKLGLERNREEIEVTHQLVKSISGVTMNLFAPPSGSFSQTTLDAAKSLGYKTILWSKDTGDRGNHDPVLIYDRAVEGLKGGDLILTHPTAETVAALPKILEYIQSAGLRAATVSGVIG